MSVEELGANCSCRSSARHAAAISISGFSDLGNQILFLQISCKNAPLKIFVKCFVAKFNHAGQSLASHLHVENLS